MFGRQNFAASQAAMPGATSATHMVESIVQNPDPQLPDPILLVDDSPANVIAYRAALESLGREIVTATSGREAVRLFGRRQFSLLLIDVRMPDMDGFATVEILRRHLHKFTPVIFATGDGDDDAMRQAYEFGAVDYLLKPVRPESLRGKVRNLLALYDQRIELERRAALLTEKNQQIAEANALLRKQDTNIGVLAHDLRNPLGAIMAGADLLTKLDGVPERARITAQRITRSARRMQLMIRDILDFTRSRLADGIPLNRQPLDLTILSKAVVDEIETAFPQASIEVETAGKLTGDWDPARIEQALSNLLANAVQHGGGRVKIVASGHEKDHVVVTVCNGGQPIPEEQLPTIFDAFKKGDKSPAGLGLGLFIVREIVRAHDGSVTVTSSADGTDFSFRLPRRSDQTSGTA